MTFSVEMHCHKMHNMLHEHLSQLEPINQPQISQSTSQPPIQSSIIYLTEWCTGNNAPTSKHLTSLQHCAHKHSDEHLLPCQSYHIQQKNILTYLSLPGKEMYLKHWTTKNTVYIITQFFIYYYYVHTCFNKNVNALQECTTVCV